MKILVIISFLVFTSGIYAECMENQITDDILKVEISPQQDSDIFMVRVIAANSWQGLPLESIVLEKNNGHVGLPIKSQPYYLDSKFSLASFWGTAEWLQNIEYCIYAAYSKSASNEASLGGYMFKVIPIVFNKALKQPSADRDAASGAP